MKNDIKQNQNETHKDPEHDTQAETHNHPKQSKCKKKYQRKKQKMNTKGFCKFLKLTQNEKTKNDNKFKTERNKTTKITKQI